MVCGSIPSGPLAVNTGNAMVRDATAAETPIAEKAGNCTERGATRLEAP